MNQYNALYFVNDVVVYKALLAKEKGGKLVYKMSIVNVVSVHLSATWQFWLFQRIWAGISLGAYGLSYSVGGLGEGGLAQVGEKPRGGGGGVQEWRHHGKSECNGLQ